MGYKLETGLGSHGFDLLVHGHTTSRWNWCRLDIGNITGCFTGDIVWTKCDWSGYSRVFHTEITSADQDVSFNTAGIPGLFIGPGLSGNNIVDSRHYGYTPEILDVLDARIHQHGTLALVIHHSSRYTP